MQNIGRIVLLFCMFVSPALFSQHVKQHVYPLVSSQIIGADHPGYLYTGRTSLVDSAVSKKKALLTWPGTSIQANFIGDGLTLVIEDASGSNYFNVILNHNDESPYVLATKKGLHEYDLSSFLKSESALTSAQETAQASTKSHSLPTHHIEIFKRTEGHEGISYFYGLKLSAQGKMLPAAKPKARRIAFYGDSVTSGMGNEAADNSPDNLPAEKNHYLSYAAIASRELNAEHHSISSSGIGFMISWFNHIMPDIYDQVSGAGDNNTAWNFAQWQPHVVVVNLGQNDSWLIDNEKRLQPEPTDQAIVKAYIGLVSALLKKHEDATFILAMGSMDITNNERWKNMLSLALKELKKANSNRDISKLEFDYSGYSAHPRVHQHRQNAKKLVAHIKRKMPW